MIKNRLKFSKIDPQDGEIFDKCTSMYIDQIDCTYDGCTTCSVNGAVRRLNLNEYNEAQFVNNCLSIIFVPF